MFFYCMKKETVKPSLSGIGNLSTKNRLRDRFSGSKFRQVTGQRFSGPKIRQESRTGFLDGDRILDRTLDRF